MNFFKIMIVLLEIETQKEDGSTFSEFESKQQSDIKVDLFSNFRERSYWEMITAGWATKIIDVSDFANESNCV